MKELEQTNLISGIIDAHNGSTDATDATAGQNTPATIDTNVEQPTQSVGCTPDEEHEDSVKRMAETVLGIALERLADTVKEAEKRGFDKALDMARRNPESLGIRTSVPNFLSTVRRDLWDN